MPLSPKKNIHSLTQVIPNSKRMLGWFLYWSKRYGQRVWQARVQWVAAAMAYQTLLALVPLLALSLAISDLFGSLPLFLNDLKPAVDSFLSSTMDQELHTGFQNALERWSAEAAGGIGLLALVLICTRLVADIDLSVQDLWHISEKRPWYKRIATYWLVLLLGPIGVSFTLGFLSPATLEIFRHLNLDLVFLALVFAFILFLNQVVPRTKVKLSRSIFASLITLVALKLAQVGYSFAVSQIINYNKIYGSLAFLPLTMFWVLLIWYCVLGGVGLCALFHEKKPDKYQEIQS